MDCRRVSKTKPIFGSRRGQALTESALVLVPLVFIILGIIDTSLALWVRISLAHAVREGARYAITYATQSGMGHDASIKQKVVDNSMGLLRAEDVTVEFFPASNPAPNSAIDPADGGNVPDNIVVVTAEREWFWIVQTIMRGGQSVTVRSSSADRMEGLGPTQTAPAR